MTPHYYQDQFATIYHGDALAILPELETWGFSCLLTDPPYSSGGLFRSDRNRNTRDKYASGDRAAVHPLFAGDNRDQRSYALWFSLWLGQCARLCAPGSHAFVFSDWRQLPTVTDAIQCGGLVWRGLVPWNKTEGSKPQKGWFRAQCEYVVTASFGSLGAEQERLGPCLAGFYTYNPAQDKHHQTGKPVPLFRFLLSAGGDGAVLDPFVGSGTTLLAAKLSGRKSVGGELSEEYCEIAAKRLAAAEPELLTCAEAV